MYDVYGDETSLELAAYVLSVQYIAAKCTNVVKIAFVSV